MDETLDSEDVAMLKEAFSKLHIGLSLDRPTCFYQTKDTARAEELMKKGFFKHAIVIWAGEERLGYDFTDKGLFYTIGLKFRKQENRDESASE